MVGTARRTEGIDALGARVSAVAADVTDPRAPERVVAEVLDRRGRLDGLVNNVGGLTSCTGFLTVTDEQWHMAFDLNFHSVVRMTRAALPALLEHGGGGGAPVPPATPTPPPPPRGLTPPHKRPAVTQKKTPPR
ncbi:SDR family NAD(P)-dependent oxidoreductase, partial [Streptomyces sp. NPDC018711]|uniref:SDR family NAD(P)-dependent oxidoreductase n=1 Tax=Streptomyces sp. NPDC018711 TaxID=3365052 RepID=UPI0037B40EE8